jgi:hypothetical protein
MKLRTYAEAIEELGGVPWRKAENTERWFVPVAESPSYESLPIIIGRPSLFAPFKNVPRTTWLIVIAAGALLAFAAVILG